ncbi:MAG TPA: DegT/DnrJ/EryC1/StrS family aminotransferase [Treponemataceae bacterium]|nr:DegT/DnrJ/EryC1/StrS family aminotransferase [Treponemataceae bacterium]
MNVEFSPPDIRQKDIDEVVKVLKSGWITTGPRTKMFEKNLSAFCNTKKTVALNSATAALELALRLLGIGKGDEVITCAYTYTASASVIDHVGAQIVLADTKPNSFHIDPQDIAKKITKHTKAIIPIDLGGVPVDYDEIFEVVQAAKSLFSADSPLQAELGHIAIIADAAHSLGAEYKGEKIGSIADFTVFSFHAVKNITTAEGGAITWSSAHFDHEALYKRFMLASLHGQSKDALAKTKHGSWEYDIVEPAYKCNMTDIQAALGDSQLQRYAQTVERRHAIIKKYDNVFVDSSVTSLEHFSADKISSGHLYLLRLTGKAEGERNRLIQSLVDCGVATNVHYKPLPMHTAYKKMGFSIIDFPNSYEQYKNEITLPLHTCLSDEQVDYVCKKVLKLIKKL